MILRVLKLRKKSKRRMGFTRNPALLLKNQVSRKASKRKQSLRRLLRWWSMLIQLKVILFILCIDEKINVADLKQKVAQTINQSMRRINAKHLEVHVSGPFQNKKMERVIGLLFLAIRDKHGWLNLKSSLNVCYWKLRRQIMILVTVKLIMRLTFFNTNLGQTVFGSMFSRIMEGHPKPSKDFLLCIHVTPLKKQLESKD